MSRQHILAVRHGFLTCQIPNGIDQIHRIAFILQALLKTCIALNQRIGHQTHTHNIQIFLIFDAVQIISHP